MTEIKKILKDIDLTIATTSVADKVYRVCAFAEACERKGFKREDCYRTLKEDGVDLADETIQTWAAAAWLHKEKFNTAFRELTREYDRRKKAEIEAEEEAVDYEEGDEYLDAGKLLKQVSQGKQLKGIYEIVGGTGIGKTTAFIDMLYNKESDAYSEFRKYIPDHLTSNIAAAIAVPRNMLGEQKAKQHGLNFIDANHPMTDDFVQIMSYDQVHKFANKEVFKNNVKPSYKVLVIDESQNSVEEMSYREKALGSMLSNVREFDLVFLLTATPLYNKLLPNKKIIRIQKPQEMKETVVKVIMTDRKDAYLLDKQAESKVLALIDNTKTCEELARKAKKRGLNIGTLYRANRNEAVGRELTSNKRLPDNIDGLNATSYISEGIDIVDSDIETIVIYNAQNRLLSETKLLQTIGRQRDQAVKEVVVLVPSYTEEQWIEQAVACQGVDAYEDLYHIIRKDVIADADAIIRKYENSSQKLMNSTTTFLRRIFKDRTQRTVVEKDGKLVRSRFGIEREIREQIQILYTDYPYLYFKMLQAQYGVNIANLSAPDVKMYGVKSSEEKVQDKLIRKEVKEEAIEKYNKDLIKVYRAENPEINSNDEELNEDLRHEYRDMDSILKGMYLTPEQRRIVKDHPHEAKYSILKEMEGKEKKKNRFFDCLWLQEYEYRRKDGMIEVGDAEHSAFLDHLIFDYKPGDTFTSTELLTAAAEYSGKDKAFPALGRFGKDKKFTKTRVTQLLNLIHNTSLTTEMREGKRVRVRRIHYSHPIDKYFQHMNDVEHFAKDFIHEDKNYHSLV